MSLRICFFLVNRYIAKRKREKREKRKSHLRMHVSAVCRASASGEDMEGRRSCGTCPSDEDEDEDEEDSGCKGGGSHAFSTLGKIKNATSDPSCENAQTRPYACDSVSSGKRTAISDSTVM